MTDRDDNQTGASRRALLMGAGAIGAVGVLAACGGTDESSAGPSAGTTTSPRTPAATTPAPAASSGTPGGGGIPVADIPVGGGKVFSGQSVVVTQPTAGNFKAFSAVCTHMGCLVDSVSDGKIGCPCHGSAYAIADGSVVTGPATKALAAKTVTKNGNSLTIS